MFFRLDNDRLSVPEAKTSFWQMPGRGIPEILKETLKMYRVPLSVGVAWSFTGTNSGTTNYPLSYFLDLKAPVVDLMRLNWTP